MKMKAAVVVAAGKSTRLGLGQNKALLLLKDTPVFIFSLKKFQQAGFDKLILVCREDESRLFKSCLEERDLDVEIVYGGARRQDSVFNALIYLENVRPDIVAIHDAARPFFDVELLQEIFTVDLLEEHSGVIFATPLTDTIKEKKGDTQILRTLDRERLIAAQTPQVFRYKDILEAYKRQHGTEDFTDDAALLERMDLPVAFIKSSAMNFKITTEFDLFVARMLVEKRLICE